MCVEYAWCACLHMVCVLEVCTWCVCMVVCVVHGDVCICVTYIHVCTEPPGLYIYIHMYIYIYICNCMTVYLKISRNP